MRRHITGLTMLACVTAALLVPGTAGASAAVCDGKVATIVMVAGGGPVTGTPGDDVIVGTSGYDVIDGAGGNDTICGLSGADLITGGAGDDRLFGGLDGLSDYRGDEDLGDWIAPGPGDDYVDLGFDPHFDMGWQDRISFRDAAGPVSVDLGAWIFTGEGTDTVVPSPRRPGVEGSMHDDHLVGSDEDDWIMAGGGDDTILGLGGSDYLKADAFDGQGAGSWGDGPTYPGDDTVDGGAGSDLIIGGHGSDVLRGGAEDDSFEIADAAGARVDGGPGRDSFLAPEYVVGAEEDDHAPSMGRVVLDGGPGKDEFTPELGAGDRVTLRGGGGRDTLDLDLGGRHFVGARVLKVDTAAGRTRLGNGGLLRFSGTEKYSIDSSTRGRLTVRGSKRAEMFDVAGWSGRTRVFASGGADRLIGGSGRDLLDGGPGRDRIDGGAGRDRCPRGEVVRRCERRR